MLHWNLSNVDRRHKHSEHKILLLNPLYPLANTNTQTNIQQPHSLYQLRFWQIVWLCVKVREMANEQKKIIITEWNKNTYILYTCIYICVYSIVRDRTQLCLCRTARLYKCNWGRPVDSLQIIHTRFPFADFNVLACIKYIICTYLYICTCKQRVEVVACGGCCECDHEQSSNVIAKVCACV